MEVIKQILDLSKLIPNTSYQGVLTNGYVIAQNVLKFGKNSAPVKDHVEKSEMLIQELTKNTQSC